MNAAQTPTECLEQIQVTTVRLSSGREAGYCLATRPMKQFVPGPEVQVTSTEH